MGNKWSSDSKSFEDMSGWHIRKMQTKELRTLCSLLRLDLDLPFQTDDQWTLSNAFL